jgi:hypothetical protein
VTTSSFKSNSVKKEPERTVQPVKGARDQAMLEKERPRVLSMIERSGSVVIRILENVNMTIASSAPAALSLCPPEPP